VFSVHFQKRYPAKPAFLVLLVLLGSVSLIVWRIIITVNLQVL